MPEIGLTEQTEKYLFFVKLYLAEAARKLEINGENLAALDMLIETQLDSLGILDDQLTRLKGSIPQGVA